MNQYNEKGLKHGPWEIYGSNGNLMYKGTFVNGKEHRLHNFYHSDNKLYLKQYYL